ncbi:MAG: hypothetical protein K2V71_09675 [Methylotenera sp.]|nr:hypothetical protein [Methylotenera sp.]
MSRLLSDLNDLTLFKTLIEHNLISIRLNLMSESSDKLVSQVFLKRE